MAKRAILTDTEKAQALYYICDDDTSANLIIGKRTYDQLAIINISETSYIQRAR